MTRFLKPILLCLAFVAQGAAAQSDSPRTITVTAEGAVFVAPDIAFVTIGVTERKPTAQEALAAMSSATAQVLERLGSADIAAEDMQTARLSLHPYFENSSISRGPKIAGFEASTTLNVRVRELQSVGQVLDAVVQDGANRLGGIRFDVEEPEPHLDLARQAAVVRAREKAELLALAAGVQLGDLLMLTEQSTQNRGPLQMEMMMDAGSSVPVAEGELSLTAHVTLVYAIAE